MPFSFVLQHLFSIEKTFYKRPLQISKKFNEPTGDYKRPESNLSLQVI